MRTVNTEYPAVQRPLCLREHIAAIKQDVAGWLTARAKQHDLVWLLAHADDGVIWGKMEGEKLVTSGQAYPAKCVALRAETLWQARLFGEQGELLLWRDDDARWHARLIQDGTTAPEGAVLYKEHADEKQILWGTRPDADVAPAKGFTLVADGAQGLHHAPPVPLSREYKIEDRPLRLQVRHYIAEDSEGFARIAASRLCRVFNEKESDDAPATTV